MTEVMDDVTRQPSLALNGALRVVDEAEYDQHRRNLNAYGFTVVKRFANADLVGRLKAQVDRLWCAAAENCYAGRPDRDRRDCVVYNLQTKDRLFIDILGAQFIQQICMEKLNDRFYRFIPPDRPNYILSYYNARSSGAKLDLHIDSYVPNAGPWCTAMQVVYLLDDTTVENGCTVVVPGSHRSGEYTDRDLSQITPILGNAGDLVLWDSKVWHGTTENTTSSSRWALVATLTQWWLKQSMDIPRSLPQEIYAQLSDEQKALLGFCALPPFDENERINTKCGYDFLKPTVADYSR